ncbi:hypothetical protein ACFQVA_38445 [Actinomadura keratinilytica]
MTRLPASWTTPPGRCSRRPSRSCASSSRPTAPSTSPPTAHPPRRRSAPSSSA